jgi:hypothetical protein
MIVAEKELTDDEMAVLDGFLARVEGGRIANIEALRVGQIACMARARPLILAAGGIGPHGHGLLAPGRTRAL